MIKENNCDSQKTNNIESEPLPVFRLDYKRADVLLFKAYIIIILLIKNICGKKLYFEWRKKQVLFHSASGLLFIEIVKTRCCEQKKNKEFWLFNP